MGDGFGICMSFYHPWIAIVSVSGIPELVRGVKRNVHE